MMTNPLNLDHRVLVDTARLLQKAHTQGYRSLFTVPVLYCTVPYRYFLTLDFLLGVDETRGISKWIQSRPSQDSGSRCCSRRL